MTQNTIGIISMFYARPFGREHFALFPRMKQAGCDFIDGENRWRQAKD